VSGHADGEVPASGHAAPAGEHFVAAKLAELGCDSVVMPISTTGDRRTDVYDEMLGAKTTRGWY